MRYLAFDIECCDGKHICEFGYVITDEKFNIINKSVITINPESKFNLVGRPGSRDLYLSFSEEQYYNSPIFTTYYDDIKNLLEYPEQIVVGHAIGNDADFLRTACKRYNLSSINFQFFDSQKAYSEYANIKKRVSLENAENEMSLEKPEKLHKSDDDALLSLRLVQAMCQNLEINLTQLMELCPAACGSSRNHMIRYTGDSLKEMLLALESNPESLSNGKKEKCIKMFNESIRPEGGIIKSRLNGKKYCFSRSFEMENIRLVLILMQLMKNHDCSYNTRVTDNELYIATDTELSTPPEPHTRFIMALEKYNAEEEIEILTFQDLYKLLNITEDEVKKMHIPIIKEKHKHKRFPKTYSSGKIDNTIGAIMRAKGIDLAEI